MSEDQKIPEASVTDYEIGQDNFQRHGLDLHRTVFPVSASIIVAVVAFALIAPATSESFFGWLRPAITSSFDWVFLIAGNIFVLFCLAVAFSPLGSVRLGGNDARPEFGYFGWFSMLFAAGMGIGLVYYGVSEPITHYTAALEGGSAAPLGGAPGDPEQARSMAMAATIYHWALHPWAIYAVVALALAFFSYNWGLPLTMRSVFYPLLGDRVWGWIGDLIDILAVFATLFGLATSLGLGADQAVAGLSYLIDIPNTDTTSIVLIVLITFVAIGSVVAGLEGGLQRLSELNMMLAAILLAFVFAMGPTLQLLGNFFTNAYSYAEHLLPLSNPVGRSDDGYRHEWTTFYWAWWMSWSPFVGMFIARVSYGRTVREFMVSTLIVPTVVSIIWMTVFGGTALTQTMGGFAGIVDASTDLQLFVMLEQLPISAITSFVGVVLVIVFFVTSSDSGSVVIDTITAGGKIDAPVPQRVFWASFEGLVAIALLLGGGLSSLRAAALTTGLPFALLLLVLCYSTLKGLMEEKREPFLDRAKRQAQAAG